MTETEIKWVIIWFHPDGDRRRNFTDEEAARRFAKTEDVAEWHPLMEKRVIETTTILVEL